MNHDRYAKPRRGGRGFARTTWRLVAFTYYRIGLAFANAGGAVLPVALDGARHLFAAFRGGWS